MTDNDASTQLGFGASGGVARMNVCADFQVSALVRAVVNPRLRQALARCAQALRQIFSLVKVQRF